jgi:DNA (cytosine-5)-methyltransferase 1
MAGRRDPKDKRNLLPWAFLEFVRKLRPKAVVIENVIGINRAFSSTSGAVSAFERLRTELENQGDGYVVQPVEVNARHFGVPQNRPRMMLIALRGDQFSGPPEAKRELWRSIDAWEASKPPNSPPLTTNEMAPTIGSQIPDDPRFKEYTAGEALIDLDETINVDEYHSGYKLDPTPEAYGSEEYRYAALMRGLTPPGARTPVARLENHETRNHTPRVVQRFHLYHFMAKHHIERSVLALARTEGSDEAVAMRVRECLGDAANLDIQGYDFAEGSDRVLFDVVMRLRTKKHTQKVVPADRPAPTVVTLPDDYIHPFQARVMTVRELARIQSFPDWFEFRARVTTGGSRRRLDVPQYSQVGNAVPPLLAQAIGKVVMRLLQRP